MTWVGIVSAIGGLGVVVGGVVYMIKLAVHLFKKSPQTKREEISGEVRNEQQKFKDTGRP